MKLFVLNMIALIIALSSLQITLDSEISFTKGGTDVLSSIPLFDLSTIRSPSDKNTHAAVVPPQSLTGLGAFQSISELLTISFLYYLPMYSLIRVKEFFLLI